MLTNKNLTFFGGEDVYRIETVIRMMGHGVLAKAPIENVFGYLFFAFSMLLAYFVTFNFRKIILSVNKSIIVFIFSSLLLLSLFANSILVMAFTPSLLIAGLLVSEAHT